MRRAPGASVPKQGVPGAPSSSRNPPLNPRQVGGWWCQSDRRPHGVGGRHAAKSSSSSQVQSPFIAPPGWNAPLTSKVCGLVVELNSAPPEVLAGLAGVSRECAYGLTLWRPYADWDDVERVPGCGPEVVQALQSAGVMLGSTRPLGSTYTHTSG